MIKGKLWELVDAEGLKKIEKTAFALLTKHGAQVHLDSIIDKLAKNGCRVEKEKRHVYFSEKLVRDALNNFCSKPAVDIETMPGWTPAKYGDLTGSFPHFLDWPSCRRRLATKQDVTDNIKMGHMLPEFDSIGKCMTCYEIDQRIEPIWSLVTIMGMTDKKVSLGEVLYPENIKHLARLGEIYSGKTGDNRFIAPYDFVIAPLIFTRRTLECMIEKTKYKVPHVPGTMPISGISGPVTIAGTAALGLAELMAGWTIYYLLDPEIRAGGVVSTGAFDMRTLRPSFGSPEAMLQNMAVTYAAWRLYGIKIGPAYNYIDSKTPGIQTTFEKMMALFPFSFEGSVFFPAMGLLSAGQDYSPVQQLLELDMKGAVERLTGTFEVSDETLGLNLYEEAEKKGPVNFLELEHTLLNYKTEQWYPKWLDRSLWTDDKTEDGREQKILNEIDNYWKDAVKKYRQPEIDSKKLDEAKKILKAAEAEKDSIKTE